MLKGNVDICIIDFGLARVTQGKKGTDLVQAQVYRAPEVCLGIDILTQTANVFPYTFLFRFTLDDGHRHFCDRTHSF